VSISLNSGVSGLPAVAVVVGVGGAKAANINN